MQMLMVREPGLYASVQDAGRRGFRQFGVPLSGAMDSYAFEMGNKLLGNKKDYTVLEIAGPGFECEFLNEKYICLTGADLDAEFNSMSVEPGKIFKVQKNDILSFGSIKSGLRAYLCVGGGIEYKKYMGSMSMLKGARLKRGDILHASDKDNTPIQFETDFSYINREGIYALRVRKGPDSSLFKSEVKKLFAKSQYTASIHHDRMGIRLLCNTEELKHDKEIITRPVFPGCIQLPGNGKPIIIMNDGQTTGGYPVFAVILKEDLRIAAQLKAGDRLEFEYV